MMQSDTIAEAKVVSGSEAEADLIRRAQTGDVAARNALVEAHIAFIHARVQAAAPGRVEEFLGHGCEAFIKCVENFDASSGFRLLTYSGISIERHIWRALRVDKGLSSSTGATTDKIRTHASLSKPVGQNG